MLQTDRFGDLSVATSGRDRSYVRGSFPAIPAAVPVARQAIVDFAASVGAPDQQLEAIRLASSEALTNVVLYAYRACTGHIHVTARLAGNELWVLIADSGCGIHAGADSHRLGLGLALISQCSDGFAVVERSTGGTELRLRFVLGGGGFRLPARVGGLG